MNVQMDIKGKYYQLKVGNSLTHKHYFDSGKSRIKAKHQCKAQRDELKGFLQEISEK